MKGRFKMKNNGCTFIASSLHDLSFGYDFESPECSYLISQLNENITEIYRSGVRDFYSICEEGIDLWAAENVLALIKEDNTVRLHCVIPYEEQAAKWQPSLRELYYTVLEQAESAEFVSLKYRDDCMRKARYRTLDQSGYVISVCESEEMREYKNYALGKGIKLVDIRSAYPNVFERTVRSAKVS